MTRLTLAIDTSQGTAVAILEEDKVLAELYEPNTMKHAEQVGNLISKALLAAGKKADQVTAVAVGIGPAPFTGLRVGIAAAKLFALGVGAKLYSVSSLDAIALGLELEKPTLLLTDARRGEVYFGLYQGKSVSGSPVLLQGPGVKKQIELEQELAQAGQSYEVQGGVASASLVGKLLALELKEGKATLGASANYLRAPDAVPAKGKKVSG